MALFHTQVSLDGFDFKEHQFTVKLAAGITSADVGKAVSQDTTADNQVKLAADGDVIVGRLEQVESRTIEGSLVGTVAFKFQGQLPVKAGQTVIRGDRLVGAGGGEVKAIANTDPKHWTAPRVWQVGGGFAVAQSL